MSSPEAISLVAEPDDAIDDLCVHREHTAQQTFVLVTAERQPSRVGERRDLGLHLGDRQLSALGAVPRMVGGRQSRAAPSTPRASSTIGTSCHAATSAISVVIGEISTPPKSKTTARIDEPISWRACRHRRRAHGPS